MDYRAKVKSLLTSDNPKKISIHIPADTDFKCAGTYKSIYDFLVRYNAGKVQLHLVSDHSSESSDLHDFLVSNDPVYAKGL